MWKAVWNMHKVWFISIKSSLIAQKVKNMPAMPESRALSLGRKDPLEKGMATHSSVFAWRIPWTEGSPWGHRVGHRWVTDTTTTKCRRALIFIFGESSEECVSDCSILSVKKIKKQWKEQNISDLLSLLHKIYKLSHILHKTCVHT